ncbi:hypothetical protein G5V59_08405 [Nocardioides sp. W3-2-3]|uniref:hypothetical protein n=1 Tax=Nocardioides convexus TaxID=2712224 RepID=UPI002418163E|nr:hypothetical protein [Nocardioides convexus]NHA00155.1 hypothetical protein [Nocardioides convexus]
MRRPPRCRSRAPPPAASVSPPSTAVRPPTPSADHDTARKTTAATSRQKAPSPSRIFGTEVDATPVRAGAGAGAGAGYDGSGACFATGGVLGGASGPPTGVVTAAAGAGTSWKASLAPRRAPTSSSARRRVRNRLDGDRVPYQEVAGGADRGAEGQRGAAVGAERRVGVAHAPIPSAGVAGGDRARTQQR